MQKQGQGAAPLPLLHPQGALAAARAAGLSEAMIGALEAERRGLSRDLEAVAQARGRLEQAAADLDGLRAQAAAARQALIAATAARVDLPPAYDSEAAAALALSMTAQDIAGLTRSFAAAPGVGQGRAAPQNLPLPLAARPVADGDGWRLQGAPGALVRAPAAGTLLYSGPLRGYRIVQILELDPGRLLVLAGLGHALQGSGTPVAAGAILGVLPEPTGGAAREDVRGNLNNLALPAGSLPPTRFIWKQETPTGP